MGFGITTSQADGATAPERLIHFPKQRDLHATKNVKKESIKHSCCCLMNENFGNKLFAMRFLGSGGSLYILLLEQNETFGWCSCLHPQLSQTGRLRPCRTSVTPLYGRCDI